MKRILYIISFFVFLNIQAQQEFHKTMKLMGSRFDITVVANSKQEATDYIQIVENEITRIEHLILYQ